MSTRWYSRDKLREMHLSQLSERIKKLTTLLDFNIGHGAAHGGEAFSKTGNLYTGCFRCRLMFELEKADRIFRSRTK